MAGAQIKVEWGLRQSWLQNCSISCGISFHHIPSVFQELGCNDLNTKGHDQGRRCLEIVSWIKQMSSIRGEWVGGRIVNVRGRMLQRGTNLNSAANVASYH